VSPYHRFITVTMSLCVARRDNITLFVTFYHLIDTVCVLVRVLYCLVCM